MLAHERVFNMLARLVSSLLLFSFCVWAQNVNGSITGVIKDGTGARIPAATVKAIRPAERLAANTPSLALSRAAASCTALILRAPSPS